jgi:hypothetical protein
VDSAAESPGRVGRSILRRDDLILVSQELILVSQEEDLSSVATLSSRYLQIRTGPAVAFSAAGLAFFLYMWTIAPGYTWANFGADGGELLAAAVTNGVPHPPGYPFYILLLQAWLTLWEWLWPGRDMAWRGNLFSAVAAATSVGFTAHLLYRFFAGVTHCRVWYALVAAVAWAAAPLLWRQALITEVYALHSLLFVLLAWGVFAFRPSSRRHQALFLGLVIGLGVAHHLTLLLLLPALFYWLWTEPEGDLRRFYFWAYLGMGVVPGLLLYLRIPIVAAATPPVNWGYPDSFSGFWWLVSGAAYQHYLFGVEPDQWLLRLSHWALVLSSQYTPIGFAVAVLGLYYLDQHQPRFRTFSLLWLLPVSLYSISYNTTDSEIYLLPVVWLLAIWFTYGVLFTANWMRQARQSWAHLFPVFVLILLLGMAVVRVPDYSLGQESAATGYLAELVEVLEPNSLVFSSADEQTFTLWYGTYATGELLEAAPGTVLVNVALYQFDWYRRLLVDLYPELKGTGTDSVEDILFANVDKRPIYFTEQVDPAAQENLEPLKSIWRYVP